MSQHIVLGMSGGVDSSVAALLLKEQGYAVEAVFMRNWQDMRHTPCRAQEDLKDAQAVCDQLDIELHVVDFSKEYWQLVFEKFLDDCAAGLTPNPDIACNREIKFSVFLQYAFCLGAVYMATGHYARIQKNEHGVYELHRGIDASKDQSYFLYTLQQKQLKMSLFPVGHLFKKEVRNVAQKHRLITQNKKDSTGICFIGERSFQSFLQEFLRPKPGPIENEDGIVLGEHLGIFFYTIGQRKGLGIGGGRSHSEGAWYVLKKDIQRNALIVGQSLDHPALYSTQILCHNISWVDEHGPSAWPHVVSFQFRHLQKPRKGYLMPHIDAMMRVHCEEPQRAVASGQAIVFYEGTRCIGGGTISSRQDL